MTRLTARLGNIQVGDNHPVAIMGVINLDPQSFYPQSYYSSPKRAVFAAEEMIEAGADILDIGGVSTAPGTSLVSVEKESTRVQTVIKQISKKWDIPMSVDTYRAEVAEEALSNGATIVNDVTGLKYDSNMASTIKDTGASCVIMATESQPGDQNSLPEIKKSLQASLRIARATGISKKVLVIDPGVGFGKPIACDLEIIRNLKSLRVFKQPLLLGVSRKNFIGQVLGYDSPDDRLYGTLGVSAVAVLNGIHVLRVHDIRATKDCITMVTALQTSRECE